jgi:hypothetical protein
LHKADVTSRVPDLPKQEEGRQTFELVQVVLPTGDAVWVRVEAAGPPADASESAGPADVGLRDRGGSAAAAVKLSGFTETICGVVGSVRAALDEHRPDSFDVEFGIAITARTGGMLSVLAAAGASAQVKVRATWTRTADGPDDPTREEPAPP